MFRLLELKESTVPSPSTKGIPKQAASLIEELQKTLQKIPA